MARGVKDFNGERSNFEFFIIRGIVTIKGCIGIWAKDNRCALRYKR